MVRFQAWFLGTLLSFFGLSSVQAEAALIPLFDGPPVAFVQDDPGSRETLFQALNNVTLSGLGFAIEPFDDPQDFRIKIFESDMTGTFGATIFDQTVSYTNVGQATYETPVNVSLTGGDYYILSLENPTADNFIGVLDEVSQGLPFTTTDGNFSVIDGGGNQDFNNILLPAFSVSTTAVPEPTSMTLLGLGLAGLAGFGLRKRK